MFLRKLKRSIEQMPRGAYIFLKFLLALSCVLLAASALLFAAPGLDADGQMLAVTLLETPAGVLLLGVMGLAILLDRG